MSNKPPVTLWTFNHPFCHITEQAEFFCSAMQEKGYKVAVSKHPSPFGLNVLIENFTSLGADTVIAFCRKYRKRVAIILTEHLDSIDRKLYFHGEKLGSGDEYIHHVTKIQRLANLLSLSQEIRSFYRLGDLPELINLNHIIPGIPLHTIPFPSIVPADRSARGASAHPSASFTFAGQPTQFRRQIIDTLRTKFHVETTRGTLSRRRRDAANANSRLVLNIPQNREWKWISTMRVLAALRCQRATVSILPAQVGVARSFCLCLSADNLLETEGSALLENYQELFEMQFSRYNAFVESDGNPAFPDSEFELWAALEL